MGAAATVGTTTSQMAGKQYAADGCSTCFWYAGCWKSVIKSSCNVHVALTEYILVADLDTYNSMSVLSHTLL